MKQLLTVLLLSMFASMARPQVTVCGRAACYDSITGTWLATMPERMFNSPCKLSVSTGPDAPPASLSLESLSADSTYVIALTDSLGRAADCRLQFTFLPIVQLLPADPALGGFSSEYRAATVLFSHPDQAATSTFTARVKWRGGTTNAPGKHKRNYKVKFDQDQSFFGLRSDNNWMLDAGQPDVFRLRNRIAMDLWNSMAAKPYYAAQEPSARNGVRGAVVELFLGSEYRGIYNFSEMMDRKQLKLKKVSTVTGQVRGCLYKGVSWDKVKMFDFFDLYDNSSETLFGYEMKYPGFDDSDTLDWAPLVAANNFVAASTDAEFQEHVCDYFDMPVVMDYNIFFNVVNAVDNSGKNMYWAVYDKTATSRLTLAPWDLDATFGQRWGGYLVRETTEGFYCSPDFRLDFELKLTYRMFRDNFGGYVDRLNERYRQLRQPGQPLHTDSILALVSRYYLAVKNSGAARREAAKWSGDSDVWGDVIDFDAEYAYICDWIRQRMDFIDQTELPLHYKQDYFEQLEAVELPKAAAAGQDNRIFDLGGREVTAPARLRPGIYVRNGRKVIIR